MKKQFLIACLLFAVALVVCLPPIQAQNNQSAPDSIPVLYQQFAGKATDLHTANLAWKPASESGIVSFELQRSTDSINFTPVLLMQAKGAIKKPNGYTYIDTELSAPHYFYRLYIQNFSGQETYSPVLRIDMKDSDTTQTETVRL